MWRRGNVKTRQTEGNAVSMACSTAHVNTVHSEIKAISDRPRRPLRHATHKRMWTVIITSARLPAPANVFSCGTCSSSRGATAADTPRWPAPRPRPETRPAPLR